MKEEDSLSERAMLETDRKILSIIAELTSEMGTFFIQQFFNGLNFFRGILLNDRGR